MDPKVYFKGMAMLRRLPDMYKELSALRKEIEALKNK
jgi:UDP-3-O-[3-hydroxymyristoyl] glucosamine N-acyltransferase